MLGGYDVGSKRKLVHEICKRISAFEQELHSSTRGIKIVETPDELYTTFISVAAGLLDDATLWSVTL